MLPRLDALSLRQHVVANTMGYYEPTEEEQEQMNDDPVSMEKPLHTMTFRVEMCVPNPDGTPRYKYYSPKQLWRWIREHNTLPGLPGCPIWKEDWWTLHDSLEPEYVPPAWVQSLVSCKTYKDQKALEAQRERERAQSREEREAEAPSSSSSSSAAAAPAPAPEIPPPDGPAPGWDRGMTDPFLLFPENEWGPEQSIVETRFYLKGNFSDIYKRTQAINALQKYLIGRMRVIVEGENGSDGRFWLVVTGKDHRMSEVQYRSATEGYGPVVRNDWPTLQCIVQIRLSTPDAQRLVAWYRTRRGNSPYDYHRAWQHLIGVQATTIVKMFFQQDEPRLLERRGRRSPDLTTTIDANTYNNWNSFDLHEMRDYEQPPELHFLSTAWPRDEEIVEMHFWLKGTLPMNRSDDGMTLEGKLQSNLLQSLPNLNLIVTEHTREGHTYRNAFSANVTVTQEQAHTTGRGSLGDNWPILHVVTQIRGHFEDITNLMRWHLWRMGDTPQQHQQFEHALVWSLFRIPAPEAKFFGIDQNYLRRLRRTSSRIVHPVWMPVVEYESWMPVTNNITTVPVLPENDRPDPLRFIQNTNPTNPALVATYAEPSDSDSDSDGWE